MNFCEGFLEIRNQRKFLVGLIILILGSFVIVFDYPQIEYFNNLESDNSITLEIEQKEINAILDKESIDISLPVDTNKIGNLQQIMIKQSINTT